MATSSLAMTMVNWPSLTPSLNITNACGSFLVILLNCLRSLLTTFFMSWRNSSFWPLSCTLATAYCEGGLGVHGSNNTWLLALQSLQKDFIQRFAMLDSVNNCFRRSILNCYLMTRSCVSDICSQDHHMDIEELCLGLWG